MQKNIKLDIKDRKILKELSINFRQPISKIAKKVKLSKQTTSYRIKKLKEREVITRYLTVVDAQMLGYNIYYIYFQFQNVDLNIKEKIIEYLIKNNYINWVVETIGKWNLVISYQSRDIIEFEKISKDIYMQFSSYLKDKSLLIVTHGLTTQNQTLFQEKGELKKFGYYGNRGVINLTKGELDILYLLRQKPTGNLVSYAKKLNITPEGVKQRISNLEKKGVIQSYSCKVDILKLGYQWVIFLFEFNHFDLELEKKFYHFLATHPNSFILMEGIGNYDIHANFCVEDRKEIDDIITEIQIKFGKIIKSYEILLISKEHKSCFIPYQIFEKINVPHLLDQKQEY